MVRRHRARYTRPCFGAVWILGPVAEYDDCPDVDLRYATTTQLGAMPVPLPKP
jgi:hypothetical protein